MESVLNFQTRWSSFCGTTGIAGSLCHLRKITCTAFTGKHWQRHWLPCISTYVCMEPISAKWYLVIRSFWVYCDCLFFMSCSSTYVKIYCKYTIKMKRRTYSTTKYIRCKHKHNKIREVFDPNVCPPGDKMIVVTSYFVQAVCGSLICSTNRRTWVSISWGSLVRRLPKAAKTW